MRSGRNQHDAAWTVEELERLREVYPRLFPEEVPHIFPGRTFKAVREKGKVLHLHRAGRQVFFPRAFGSSEDGGYVTGLTDGEGSFMVSVRRRNGVVVNFNPKFGINLRADDKPILDWTRNYFDCGQVTVCQRKNSARVPMASFWVASTYDLLRSIVPHFRRFPLRAKKRRDFAIWLEMVDLSARYYRCDWPDSVRVKMALLYQQLRSGRRYA